MNDKQFMTFFLGVMGVLTIIFFVIFFIAQICVIKYIFGFLDSCEGW